MSAPFEAKIERLLSDGSITQHDADTVLEFADFLREKGPARGKPGYDPVRELDALIKFADLCGFTPEQVEQLTQARARRG